ncbi:MAG: trigger factor [Chloroflexi bacterium]|nr:trigger factor [Chloroflexota bacterium]
MEITVSSETLEKSRVKLTVDVPLEEVEIAYKRAVRRVSDKVNIPGFRRGRAPQALVERHAGVESVFREALDRLVPEAYAEALKQTEIQPVGSPELELLQAEKDQAVSFAATVPVKPEVDTGDYRAIQITKEKRLVTDEDIEVVLQSLEQQLVQWDEMDRPVEVGDRVKLDLRISVEGRIVTNTPGANLIIGENTMPEGFDEAATGMVAGQERSFILLLPDDYAVEAVRGKSADFEIKVLGTSQKRLLGLTDDLAKATGDFETIDELRADVRKRLEMRAEQDAEQQAESTLVQELVSGSTFEVPDVLIEEQAQRLEQREAFEAAQRGIPKEYYLQMINLSEEEWKQRLQERAEGMVRNFIALDAVASQEAISVPAEEIKGEIEQSMANYRMQIAQQEQPTGMIVTEKQPSKDQVQAQLQQMEQYLNSDASRTNIAMNLRMRKTIDFLKETVTIEEVTVEAKAEESPAEEASAEAPASQAT